MSDIQTWSNTAASNNATPPNGFPEGMAPSTVNDAARELMAAVSRYRSDTDGVNTSAGTNTITLAASRTMTAYAQGDLYTFKAGGTNTGATTLNVDSLGAKDVQFNGNACTGGEIVSGLMYTVVYDGTQFQLLNASSYPAIDITTLEVTNIKAKDGTASMTIANSTGVVTIDSAVLTTATIPTLNSTTIDIAGNNTGLTSADPVNTLRFTDTDTTTAANQPIGKIEFYNSDTGNAAVGAYILASAAGTSGGGKLRLGAAANAGAASDMVTISSNKVEMVGETTSNSFQALGSVYSNTLYGLSAFHDVRTYSGASNLSYTASLFINNIVVSGSGQIIDQYGVYIAGLQSGTGKNYGVYSNLSASGTNRYNFYANGTAPNYFEGNVEVGSGSIVVKGAGAIGYGTGSGGTVTQATSRTTGVTLDKTNGSITLVSAAGTATWQSFTVTNSTVAATDVVVLSQKSGTDLYMLEVTAVAAGSFRISFATTGGTTTEQPVFNFAVIKAVTS